MKKNQKFLSSQFKLHPNRQRTAKIFLLSTVVHSSLFKMETFPKISGLTLLEYHKNICTIWQKKLSQKSKAHACTKIFYQSTVNVTVAPLDKTRKSKKKILSISFLPLIWFLKLFKNLFFYADHQAILDILFNFRSQVQQVSSFRDRPCTIIRCYLLLYFFLTLFLFIYKLQCT